MVLSFSVLYIMTTLQHGLQVRGLGYRIAEESENSLFPENVMYGQKLIRTEPKRSLSVLGIYQVIHKRHILDLPSLHTVSKL